MDVIETPKLPGRQRNRPIKDYAGHRFGRLTATQLVERMESRDHRWAFLCDCGNEKIASIRSVRSGNTSSCGCRHKEQLVARNATHGLSKVQPGAYRSWKDMRARCSNPGDSDFVDYGGRGIRVCAEWDDFAVFFADMGPRPKGRTLDRIDVNGGYQPSNCRWATSKTQANNKRSNARLTIAGETKTLQEWSEYHGLERTTVRWRLAQGWALERVFSKEDFRRL